VIIVEITASGSHLQLTIVDDGPGLDSVSRLETGGSKNMRIRAQLLGAQVQIEKGPDDKGTCVQVSLPLPAQAE